MHFRSCCPRCLSLIDRTAALQHVEIVELLLSKKKRTEKCNRRRVPIPNVVGVLIDRPMETADVAHNQV